MIAQFKQITGVGKFVNFTPKSGSQHELKKWSVVFGRNTFGKSTLTAIVRSLLEDKPDYIIGRKTFGETTLQRVVIKETTLTGTQQHVFESNSWRSTMPGIRIFDAKYVRQNVHTEEAVLDNHQNKLEALVLGSEGERLMRLLNGAEQACKLNADRKTTLTVEYNTYLKTRTDIDFREFIKLKPDENIQKKIEQQNADIESYKKYDDIKKVVLETYKLLDSWDFSYISSSLKQKLEISQQAITHHIEHNLKRKDRALEFLHAGFDQLADDICPFCSQRISSDESRLLISELSKLFSETYRGLRQSIRSAEDVIKYFEPNKDLTSRLNRLNDLGEGINLEDVIGQMIEVRAKVIDEIGKKNDDLSYTFNEQVINDLTDKITEAKKLLEGLRQQYAGDFNKDHLEKLVDALRELEIINERSSQRWVDNCNTYEKLESNTSELTEARGKALKDKNSYAEEVFAKYSKRINEVLQALGANFEIADLQPRPTIKSNRPLYAIKFGGRHPISIVSDAETEANFDNTLSESDKRLLGFAFFLAEVDLDPQKKDLVLILDDPMSSFDTERKRATAKILDQFSDEVEQIIVLTHEENFLKTLHKQFNDCALFKIDAKSGNGSSIESMNIDDEYLDAHYKSISILESIAKGEREATPTDLRCMRDVIEGILKRKYYLLLKDDIRNKQSVRGFMDTLKNASVYPDDEYDALAKDIYKLDVHFWNHNDDFELITRDGHSAGDLRTFAQDFLKIIHKL